MQRTVDSSVERRYRFKSDGRQSRRSRAETVEKAAEEGRQSALPDTKSNSKFILAAGKDRHYAAQTVLTVFFPFGTVAGSTPARFFSSFIISTNPLDDVFRQAATAAEVTSPGII